MQKLYPKSDQNGLQKGTPKQSQNHKNGLQKRSQKGGPKKHRKNTIFSTSECSQSVINTHQFDDFQVLVLTPFWVSFWRCFGSPNGGQGHLKAISKKHQKMMPKMTPNWSQRGSQNGAKIIKNEVLEASCFKDGSQVASRDPPGSILERFWDHFGTMFVNFLTYFL